MLLLLLLLPSLLPLLLLLLHKCCMPCPHLLCYLRWQAVAAPAVAQRHSHSTLGSLHTHSSSRAHAK
jgi:hypothetical protein